MSTQPKKKDFWNNGKGVNPNDFEADTCSSPPLSPKEPGPSTPPSLSLASVSPRPLEFPQSFSAPGSPPPLYPLHHPYSLYSPSYHAHNPYLPSPLCPSGSTGPYPLPTMSYGALDLNAAAAHGAASIASTPFAEPHLTQAYGASVSYPAEMRARGRSREAEGSQQDKESTSQGSTRQQKCSLCFNHGFTREKKGHKWRCEFKDCDCPRCCITKGRQKTMREQQKLTRHLQKMQL